MTGSELTITYGPEPDVIIIEGVKYACDIFRSFSAFVPGSVLKIVKREDNVLTVERLYWVEAQEKGKCQT